MEILKTLEEQGENLFPEDLDFFETELATGGPYTAEYQMQCQKQIQKLRAWMNGDRETEDEQEKAIIPKEKGNKMFVDFATLMPTDETQQTATVSEEQMIFNDINQLRTLSDYKTRFKKYVTEHKNIDSDFVDKNYSFFQIWELNAIVSLRQMGEPFLEKYFGALDKKAIAKDQLYSEAFFMKHYAQLDEKIVLERSKNEWRKKGNRSKQLDVFLRLKGVKI